jgi:hypothetical protein
MKGVTDISGESAGESLVAIRADESEFDATGDQLCLPVAAIEAFATAVECVLQVRHPSYGGQRDFVRQVRYLYGLHNDVEQLSFTENW